MQGSGTNSHLLLPEIRRRMGTPASYRAGVKAPSSCTTSLELIRVSIISLQDTATHPIKIDVPGDYSPVVFSQ